VISFVVRMLPPKVRPVQPGTLKTIAGVAAMVAVLGFAAGWVFDWDVALIFAFSVGQLCPSMAVISKWKSERGIWMWCALWVVCTLPFVVLVIVGIMRDVVRDPGRHWAEVPLGIAVMAPWCLSIWWSSLCGIWNWWIFREGLPPSRPPPDPSPVPAPLKPRLPELSAAATAETESTLRCRSGGAAGVVAAAPEAKAETKTVVKTADESDRAILAAMRITTSVTRWERA